MKDRISFDLSFRENPYSGLYVAVEGIDGSGKTTQIANLAREFKNLNKQFVITSEPNDSLVIGKLIRDILFSKIKIPSSAFQFLYSADRSVNHATIIEPALRNGKMVISHRTFWSNIPHGVQDLGKDISSDSITDSLITATGMLSYYYQFIKADLTFYLDVSIDTVMQRLSGMDKKKDIYERQDKLEQILKGYKYILQRFPKEIIVIDGEKDPEDISRSIFDIIKEHKKYI